MDQSLCCKLCFQRALSSSILPFKKVRKKITQLKKRITSPSAPSQSPSQLRTEPRADLRAQLNRALSWFPSPKWAPGRARFTSRGKLNPEQRAEPSLEQIWDLSKPSQALSQVESSPRIGSSSREAKQALGQAEQRSGAQPGRAPSQAEPNSELRAYISGLTRAPLGYFYSAPHWGGGAISSPPLWSPKLLDRF